MQANPFKLTPQACEQTRHVDLRRLMQQDALMCHAAVLSVQGPFRKGAGLLSVLGSNKGLPRGKGCIC